MFLEPQDVAHLQSATACLNVYPSLWRKKSNTRHNIRNPLRTIWLKLFQSPMTNRHPLLLVVCSELVGHPSCTLFRPAKVVMDNGMCASVAYTKLQGKESECSSGVLNNQGHGSLHSASGHCCWWSVSTWFMLSLSTEKCWTHLASVRNDSAWSPKTWTSSSWMTLGSMRS